MTIALSILAVFGVLAFHWLGLFLIRTMFEALLVRFGRLGAWGDEFSFAVAILALVMLNFGDVLLCSLILVGLHPELQFFDLVLFSIGNYTTLGATPPSLSPIFAVAGPLIAMCGIFVFGWTTSFLVSCSNVVRDAAVARRKAAGNPTSRIR